MNTPKPEVRKRKPRMIEEGSRTYERMANEEAKMWCQLRPCRDCGAPVNDGYCCNRCGSRNP